MVINKLSATLQFNAVDVTDNRKFVLYWSPTHDSQADIQSWCATVHVIVRMDDINLSKKWGISPEKAKWTIQINFTALDKKEFWWVYAVKFAAKASIDDIKDFRIDKSPIFDKYNDMTMMVMYQTPLTKTWMLLQRLETNLSTPW